MKAGGGLALLLGKVAEKKGTEPDDDDDAEAEADDGEADADAEMARPVLRAIKSNDAGALAKALKEFYESCDMG